MGFSTYCSLVAFFLSLIYLSPPAYCFCPVTSCTNSSATPIRFPFNLQHQQPENCSYPGFTLYCTDTGLTALNLPQSGQFLVRKIDYQSQSIHLYDPKSCLPRRLLDGIDPSGSPFTVDSFMNYTFLSCPREFTDNRFKTIECLSNSSRSILATSQTILARKMSNRKCYIFKNLTVPVSIDPLNDEGYTSGLTDDISLSWDVPDCKDCEVKGGVCGLSSNVSQQIDCFYDPPANSGQEAENSKSLKVFRIIAFSIAIPAILCAVGIGFFLCMIDRREVTANWTNRRLQQVAAVPQPQEIAMGLDQATIDSYSKVVLGESRRVPGRSDGSCPICLSDFTPQETLRCIPDCQHCFHADCIDEWLKMNGTCPLCRSSPAHQLQLQVSTTLTHTTLSTTQPERHQ